MNRTHTQATWLAYAMMAALVLVVAVAWHFAVVATTSARLLDPRAGVLALRALIDLDTTAEPATTATFVWWFALLVLTLGVIGAALAIRALRAAPRAGKGQLASGRVLRRTIMRQSNVAFTKPFAWVDGKALPLRIEDNGAVVSPPRIGKTMYVAVGLIADAPGAVVATSTKPDVLRLTAGIRRKVGRVFVFDPEGVSRWPDPVRWDMVAGCVVPEEAQERADALVGSRDLGDGRNSQFFQEAASTVLRCLLHAAALKPGGTMRDVVRWARDFELDEPYDILGHDHRAVAGWVDDLRKFCRGAAHETTSSTDMSLGLVLKSFALPSVLDAVCPQLGKGFDPSTFFETHDTLYLLSRSGKVSVASPIITALVTAIERRARLASGHTVTGRIDPPLTLVLDEVANVAPVRGLDSLMSDGGGRGVIAWPFAQSRGQLAQRYGREDAKTILDSASVFLMLSGSKDFEHLKELSDLSGTTRVERTSHTTSSGSGMNTGSGSTQHSTEREALMPPEQIRTMGVGKAYLLYRDAAPAIATLVPFWERPDKADFEESRRWVLEREGLRPDAVSLDAVIRATLADVDDEQVA